MTTTAPPRRTARTRPRRTAAGWVPRQHGAWAMLLVPFWLGALTTGVRPWTWTLFATWVLGYFTFNAASLALKAAGPQRRWSRATRYRKALLCYGLLTAVCGVLTVVLASPHLLAWAAAYAPLTLIALLLAANRHERATIGGLCTVAAAALMTVTAGYPDPVTALNPLASRQWLLAAIAFAYFFGTVLYVKTLIRHRGQPAWVLGSCAYHLVATIACGALAILPAGALASTGQDWRWPAFFAVTSVRAALVPTLGPMRGRTVTPTAAGVGEAAFSALLVVLALLP